MPKGMQPIYTQTVAGMGGTTLYFNNIPQNYTDLMLIVSSRGVESTVANYIYVRVNNAGAAGTYSRTTMGGNGTSVTSDRATGAAGDYLYNAQTSNASATANAFGNAEIFIPNYTSTFYKQVISTGVSENNATYAIQTLSANSILHNAPITSLLIGAFGGLAQHSTVTLYGISR